ncbi:hypothetical protein CONPUDRAFT_167455 [Coniophora puteana RWD-64-598 SS2]|uniref:Oxidoreductase AflY n=1 Tax=Coniophora puteana (strain RWD-64-598) TaxID=741705 RepID=A0A5M3MGU0_CONPW|nr:uncharacterized protein CONPUDRAFT_167455 [Coniophora puteana RWD-64-598 SS2]EIW78449.1 hypothetical protein CONPUDRAFT_167455 [Coniophora puteana RWD-64-598 SS2]
MNDTNGTNGVNDAATAALFPAPAPVPSTLSPRRWPGVDAESTKALLKGLRHNHVQWDMYFDDVGRHNHSPHQLLSIWAMGASGPVIDAAYKMACVYQRELGKPPETITKANVWDHLGDMKYFGSYSSFFCHEIREKGFTRVMEEYVFSRYGNISDKGSVHPVMVNRIFGGIFHPWIHIGFGAEFGQPGLVAEGLAMACTQDGNPNTLLQLDSWEPKSGDAPGVLSALSNLSLNALLSNGTTTARPSSRGLHALAILARMQADPAFDDVKDEELKPSFYEDTFKLYGDALRKYASMWEIDTSTEAGSREAFEQLALIVTIMYGVAGWTKENALQPDFVLVHLVTSALFFPSVNAYLSRPELHAVLLRAFFTLALGYFVARGRPKVDLATFYAHTTTLGTPRGAAPQPAVGTLPGSKSPHALTPNTWLPIMQTSLVHPNEHLPKAQRSFAHFAELFGHYAPGEIARKIGADAALLPGAERLDGTVFVRVALLTADAMGWMREGQERGLWSYRGFCKEVNEIHSWDASQYADAVTT